ncbi:ABC-2 family transporter protein [Ruminococcus sp. YE71]|uniref:ABC transporter permease n=1 Tax=unclassified Ruminococcus TaxID=2608920 RepID=UPI000890C111|nr:MULTISPECIES: ABC transporter permease [unclassified Ruminococcus]SDA26511.1 ABC-2 family transporter protein [Ruminococcus sp. YE78]SFW44158.1 ABC-2 family transporter protein [Ruminococcus sp. YE71]
MVSVIKTTMKLLLRNKGFIFFLTVIPLLSTLILSLKVDHDVDHCVTEQKVIELDSAETRAIYKGDHEAFIIKVYDGSESELSGYLLDTLAAGSMFSVCRADVTDMSGDEVRKRAEKDAFDDRAGMIMYLKAGFDSAVMNDSLSDGIELFKVSEDGRQEMFTTELSDILSRMYRSGTVCGGDSSKTIEMLHTISGQMPKKTVKNIAGGNKTVLTAEQNNNKTQIGYAFAFLTLGFMFSGVFAAHTVITESNNKVYTRIMLTGISNMKYFTAKFIVVVMMCLLQTGVLAVCLTFIKDLDLGMPYGLFLVIVFLLGLIFGSFSMLTGIVFGDIMSSNYAVFAVWSVSAMLSGLFFPIGETSELLRSISYLMPQRWFIEACEKLITGGSGAFRILASATVSYLIVIISLGSVGLKIRKQET